jgi:hypothetical protein
MWIKNMILHDEVFERILENKNSPFVARNACTPSEILTWNNVDRYINDNVHNSAITIISEHNKKITYKSTDTGYTPTKQIYTDILDGSSFVLNFMERYTPGLFYVSNIMSQMFDRYVTTNIYGGVKSYATSFNTHADSQYVLILHLSGESEWIIFNEVWNGNSNEAVCANDSILSKTIHTTLTAGDVLYIPHRRYHKCIPHSKRLSASISVDYDSSRPDHYGHWFNLEDI